jgi:hypothetical protein
MQQVVEYKIVVGNDVQELVKKVNTEIENGKFQPHGSPVVIQVGSAWRYMQPMIRV